MKEASPVKRSLYTSQSDWDKDVYEESWFLIRLQPWIKETLLVFPCVHRAGAASSLSSPEKNIRKHFLLLVKHVNQRRLFVWESSTARHPRIHGNCVWNRVLFGFHVGGVASGATRQLSGRVPNSGVHLHWIWNFLNVSVLNFDPWSCISVSQTNIQLITINYHNCRGGGPDRSIRHKLTRQPQHAASQALPRQRATITALIQSSGGTSDPNSSQQQKSSSIPLWRL